MVIGGQEAGSCLFQVGCADEHMSIYVDYPSNPACLSDMLTVRPYAIRG